MNTFMSKTDRLVAQYLKDLGIKVSVILTKIGAKQDGWEHDEWLYTIGSETFKYSTGTGHRTVYFGPGNYSPLLVKKLKELLESLNTTILTTCRETQEVRRNPNKATQYYRAYARTKPAPAASVLHNILSDMFFAEDTFEGFCNNLGYNTDSRKALETYLACQENGAKLHRIFTKEQIEALEVLLEDY